MLAIILGMIFSGIQICLSAYAKSFKEAQTYTSLMILIPLFLAYGTIALEAGDIQYYQMLVPILNVICTIKMVLGGIINYYYILTTIGASLVFLAIIIIFTRWLFTRESLLLRA